MQPNTGLAVVPPAPLPPTWRIRLQYPYAPDDIDMMLSARVMDLLGQVPRPVQKLVSVLEAVDAAVLNHLSTRLEGERRICQGARIVLMPYRYHHQGTHAWAGMVFEFDGMGTLLRAVYVDAMPGASIPTALQTELDAVYPGQWFTQVRLHQHRDSVQSAVYAIENMLWSAQQQHPKQMLAPVLSLRHLHLASLKRHFPVFFQDFYDRQYHDKPASVIQGTHHAALRQSLFHAHGVTTPEAFRLAVGDALHDAYVSTWCVTQGLEQLLALGGKVAEHDPDVTAANKLVQSAPVLAPLQDLFQDGSRYQTMVDHTGALSLHLKDIYLKGNEHALLERYAFLEAHRGKTWSEKTWIEKSLAIMGPMTDGVVKTTGLMTATATGAGVVRGAGIMTNMIAATEAGLWVDMYAASLRVLMSSAWTATSVGLVLGYYLGSKPKAHAFAVSIQNALQKYARGVARWPAFDPTLKRCPPEFQAALDILNDEFGYGDRARWYWSVSRFFRWFATPYIRTAFAHFLRGEVSFFLGSEDAYEAFEKALSYASSDPFLQGLCVLGQIKVLSRSVGVLPIVIHKPWDEHRLGSEAAKSKILKEKITCLNETYPSVVEQYFKVVLDECHSVMLGIGMHQLKPSLEVVRFLSFQDLHLLRHMNFGSQLPGRIVEIVCTFTQGACYEIFQRSAVGMDAVLESRIPAHVLQGIQKSTLGQHAENSAKHLFLAKQALSHCWALVKNCGFKHRIIDDLTGYIKRFCHRLSSKELTQYVDLSNTMHELDVWARSTSVPVLFREDAADDPSKQKMPAMQSTSNQGVLCKTMI